MSTPNDNLLNPETRVLSTLEADGKRRWIHPRLSKGKHWHRRRAVAWLLIAFFTLLPWLRWNGDPLVLLDIPRRKFLLFGTTFLPTDTLPLALAVLAIFLSIFFLTAVLGRVWCGWGCPQTVYMEFVFRPIERLFQGRKGVGGKPRKNLSGWRWLAMYAVFLVACAHLANTFLAYFVGTENLTRWIWTTTPWQHPGAFALFIGITGFMMFDFAYWREQLCIIGCPYGRFQSVMLDRQSLVISYDPPRGEPRGKPRKAKRGAEVALPVLGDCVDCNQCVDVCPTGIDIRDGLQLECINCAQCIDACNDIMTRFDRPQGLIRYSSQDAIDGKPAKLLRPRVVLYPLAVCGLLTALVVFLLSKPTSDIEVMRTFGRPFAVMPDGRVDNTLRVKITNRTDASRTYTFSTPSTPTAELVVSPPTFALEPGATTTGSVRVLLPYDAFTGGRLTADLEITDDLGTAFTHPLRLQGPTAPPASRQAETEPADAND
ncbi:MAG: cytochrome c oxidase accessory protein CcoG [Planctomycetota bacterium]